MSQVKNKISSSLFRNILVLVSGTAAANVITILLTPIVTRLYSPDAMGLLGLFNSTVSVLTPLIALTLPIAIVLPRYKREAIMLIKATVLLTFMFTSLISVVLIVFHEQIINSLGWSDNFYYTALIPLALCLGSLIIIWQQILIRGREFSVIAKSTMLQSFTSNGIKVTLGVILPTGLALILSTIAGKLLQLTMMMCSRSKGFSNKKILNAIRVIFVKHNNEVVKVIKKYSDFPKFRLPQNLLNSISQNIPVILVAYYYSPSEAGFYVLAKTVLGMPANMISKSVGDAYYPKANSMYNAGTNLYSLTVKTSFILALVGIVPFLIFIYVAPDLFSLVFGDEWYEAGLYGKYLAFWYFSGFINKPSITVIPIISKQNIFLVYEALSLMLRLLFFYLGLSIYGTALASIIALSVAASIMNIVLVLYVLYFLRKKDKN